MEACQSHCPMSGIMPFIIALILWDSIWKLIALWKAAKNDKLAWFISLAILNTAGILPIIYILMNRKLKKKAVQI